MIYFSHDVGASSDDKIIALRLEGGGAAVDAYWCVLEAIYREEGPFRFGADLPQSRALAYKLCADVPTLQGYLDAMVRVGLLAAPEPEGNGASAYSSARAIREIEDYSTKREALAAGGRKGRKRSAKAAATGCASPAVDGGPGKTAEAKSQPSSNLVATKLEPSSNLVGTRPAYIEEEKKKEVEEELEEKEREGERTRAGAGTDGGEAEPEPPETPTLEEVRAFFGANGWTVDPDRYWADRESMGWRKRGQPIERWRADALGWAKREPEFRQLNADRSARGRPRGDPDRAPEGPRFERVKSAREQLAEFEREHGRGGEAA